MRRRAIQDKRRGHVILTVRSRSEGGTIATMASPGVHRTFRRTATIRHESQTRRKQKAVMEQSAVAVAGREPWNKGKLVGQKAPLKLKEIWAIRIRLQISGNRRDLALFNLAIDSKLRACDLVKIRVRDVSHGDRITPRAIVMQQKTRRPVQFELTEVPAKRLRHGLLVRIFGQKISCFPVESTGLRTCRRVNTRGSSTHGCATSFQNFSEPAIGFAMSSGYRKANRHVVLAS